jgi:DNA-directed RNA polymerase specialized sigma24 family protein
MAHKLLSQRRKREKMVRKSSVSGPDDSQTSTNKLLGVMIALLLRQGQDGPPSLKQQIETLSDLGLRPSEIASILGRSSTHVNKELTGIRKGK